MAKQKRKKTRPARADSAQGGFSSAHFAQGQGGYWDESRKPLTSLAFLLPLILLYQIQIARLLATSEGVLTNRAHLGMVRLLELVGMSPKALFLPGFLLIAILLTQHAWSRRPWRVDLATVVRMHGESLGWAFAVLVASQLLLRAAPVAASGVDFASLPLASRIAVAIGAGLYEELIFRMTMFYAIGTLFHDLLGLSRKHAMAIAVGLSSILFMGYHSIHDESGAVVWSLAFFYFAAGIAFGLIYARRGFGIAAGTHAFYDIATALLAATAARGAT